MWVEGNCRESVSWLSSLSWLLHCQHGRKLHDSLDPERLLWCPYGKKQKKAKKNHQIRACRFPYHLIKWRKNHPDVTNTWATCPFGALHQLPQAEISHHISSCDDKRRIEQDVVRKSGTLDKRLWPRACGSALLVMKTRIKISGERPAPHLWGIAN